MSWSRSCRSIERRSIAFYCWGKTMCRRCGFYGGFCRCDGILMIQNAQVFDYNQSSLNKSEVQRSNCGVTLSFGVESIFPLFGCAMIYLYQFIGKDKSMCDINQTWGGLSQKQRINKAATKIFPQITTSAAIDGSMPPKLPLRQMDYCLVCCGGEAKGFLMECRHKNLCLYCAEKMVLADIESNKDSKCPIAHCQKGISREKESFLTKFSKQTRQKLAVYEFKKSFIQPRNIHSCQHPDCEGVINLETSQCILCEKKHCERCFRLAHEDRCIGISHNLMGVNDLKKCRNCRLPIYKEGGCSKIICPRCREAMCFECMEEWAFRHHGCSEYGWFSTIFYFFQEKCCSTRHTGDQYQLILPPVERRSSPF